MPMNMVCVRRMRMVVSQWYVLVPMAVRALDRIAVGVVVVPIIVGVGMLMRQRFVRMRMRVPFHQMQPQPGQHQ